MTEVQLTVSDRNDAILFFTMGMGVNYAAARAAANVGMRARIASDRTLSGKVRSIECERI